MYGKGLRALSLATFADSDRRRSRWCSSTRRIDADQGFIQKIFYVHVPLAIVALGGFVAGGVLRHPAPAHARPRAGTCAPTWRSTWR